MAVRAATFEGVVKKAGINPYVDLPKDRAIGFGQPGHRAVRVRVKAMGAVGRRTGPRTIRDWGRLIRIGRLTRDGWFRTHVVPIRGGRCRSTSIPG